ncbi:hypothetical protein MPER_02645 [Moniliophthora perniciosa FA553]|nr:hypothetical protein MPER_02645 [Moniliophthora perniciosa FA553]
MNSNCDPQEEDEEKEEDYDDDDDDECCQRAMKSGPVRPEVAFSASSKGGTLPRVSFASLNQKKKKKLVISGIAPNEARKFDGAKRWCEDFWRSQADSEMPKWDLHVHFGVPSADTVIGTAQIFADWNKLLSPTEKPNTKYPKI